MLLEGFKISWLVWSILMFWLVRPRSKQLDPSSLPTSTPSRSHEAEEVNLSAALLNVNELWVDWVPSQYMLCWACEENGKKYKKKNHLESLWFKSRTGLQLGWTIFRFLRNKLNCIANLSKKKASLWQCHQEAPLLPQVPQEPFPLWAASQLYGIIPAFFSLQLTLGRITEALESTTHAKVHMGKAGSS